MLEERYLVSLGPISSPKRICNQDAGDFFWACSPDSNFSSSTKTFVVEKESILQQTLSLHTILKEALYRNSFKSFLQKFHLHNSMQFISQVKSLQKLSDPEQYYLKARKIIWKFIEAGSLLELKFLSHSLRQDITKQFVATERTPAALGTLFDLLKKSVVRFLKTKILPLFLQSLHFRLLFCKDQCGSNSLVSSPQSATTNDQYFLDDAHVTKQIMVELQANSTSCAENAHQLAKQRQQQQPTSSRRRRAASAILCQQPRAPPTLGASPPPSFNALNITYVPKTALNNSNNPRQNEGQKKVGIFSIANAGGSGRSRSRSMPNAHCGPLPVVYHKSMAQQNATSQVTQVKCSP